MAQAGDVMSSLSLGQEVRVVRPAADSDGELLQIEVTQEPGPLVPPHVHPAQEERFEVVEGAIQLRIGRRRIRVSAGETARVPAGSAHSLSACDGCPARLRNEFRPALRTEDCFAATFALDGRAIGALDRIRELARIAQRYPQEFLFYVPLVPWRIQHRALIRLIPPGGGPDGVADARAGEAPATGGAPEPEAAGGVPASRSLGIYMNDQLAAGVAWREVARRTARENRGTPGGEELAEVADAIAEDVERFAEIMTRLEIPRSRLKPALAMAAERAGRLKLNGRLAGYSPLSRFLELDVLAMGIEGKKILWVNLAHLAHLRERLPDVDFDALMARAQEQRDRLEPFRAQAGAATLGAGWPAPAPAAVPGDG
ncbi:MAG: cupin domain-containing protein [Solirubrobacteraceae bacterium]